MRAPVSNSVHRAAAWYLVIAPAFLATLLVGWALWRPFQEAVETKPASVENLQSSAELLEGLLALGESTDLRNRLARIYVDLGKLQRDAEPPDPNAAAEAFAKAIRNRPDTDGGWPYLFLARQLDQAGAAPDEVFSAYEDALQAGDLRVVFAAHDKLAVLLLTQRDSNGFEHAALVSRYDKWSEECRQAVLDQDKPSGADALWCKAVALLDYDPNEDDRERALDWMRRYQRLRPWDDIAAYYLNGESPVRMELDLSKVYPRDGAWDGETLHIIPGKAYRMEIYAATRANVHVTSQPSVPGKAGRLQAYLDSAPLGIHRVIRDRESYHLLPSPTPQSPFDGDMSAREGEWFEPGRHVLELHSLSQSPGGVPIRSGIQVKRVEIVTDVGGQQYTAAEVTVKLFRGWYFKSMPPDAESPLTILQFASSSSWNGEAAHVASLCRSLSAAGHCVILAYRTLRKGQPVTLWEERLESLGVQETIPLAMDSGFYPAQLYTDLQTLRARLGQEPAVDILHAHRSQDHWLAGLLRIASRKKPALVRTRHVTTAWTPHFFDHRLYSRTDLVISTCTQIDDVLSAAQLVPDTRRAVLHGGVDVSRFSPEISGAAFRQEFQTGEDETLVTAVGHLDPVKGYEVFIDALAKVQREISNVRGVIVGQAGKTKPEELARRGAALQLNPPLLLTGERRDVPAILAASDLGIACSLGSEGNSRAVLEMMAMRVPLVVTDVGALPDLVTDGESGSVVAHGDANALAEGIVRMLKNPDARTRFAETAYDRVHASYAEPIVATRLAGLYQSAKIHLS